MHGTDAQIITLPDLPKNYKKIEIVIGAVGYDAGVKQYYYPYLDTITFYPTTSKNGKLYAHKSSNYFTGSFLRWQVELNKDSNKVYSWTHQKDGYWQGMFISAIYGYK